jgi:hypothetical protein
MDVVSINNLPAEILMAIFDYIQEDSLNLRQVCTEWNSLVTKYKTKRSLIFPSQRYDTVTQLFPRGQFKVKIQETKYIKQYLANTSALDNIHMLDLSWTQVTDVSALGNVHTLDLQYTQVADVSALGNVHTLILWGMLLMFRH